MPATYVKDGTWEKDLRRQLKREHGAGWGLFPQSKGTKLTRRYQDGSKQSVMLSIAWSAGNATAIANEVAVLIARMKEHDISLKEAHNRANQVGGIVTADGVKAGTIDWSAISESFLLTRSDRRGTTLRDTSNRVANAVTLLTAAKRRPRDGRELMEQYAATFFDRCPAGGNGRKRHLGDVAAFLTYAIDKAGVPGLWQPLEGDERQVLIGTADDVDSSLTPPVKPEQLAALLDALEADGKSELHLAVALIGCFGLRPAELAALEVEDGCLKVGSQVKRNRRSMKSAKPPRLALPLELDGRTDGAKALALYSGGLVKLPLAIRTAISSGEFKKVGDAFRQLMDRYPFWQSMVAVTPGLTPYSLRHGWAWRAHKGYDNPLSVRDAAALMGHTPTTHHRHYGTWTDDKGLKDAVERLTQPQRRSAAKSQLIS